MLAAGPKSQMLEGICKRNSHDRGVGQRAKPAHRTGVTFEAPGKGFRAAEGLFLRAGTKIWQISPRVGRNRARCRHYPLSARTSPTGTGNDHKSTPDTIPASQKPRVVAWDLRVWVWQPCRTRRETATSEDRAARLLEKEGAAVCRRRSRSAKSTSLFPRVAAVDAVRSPRSKKVSCVCFALFSASLARARVSD